MGLSAGLGHGARSGNGGGIVVVVAAVLQLEPTLLAVGVSGLPDLGRVMACQASFAQGQTMSSKRWASARPEAHRLQRPGPGVSGGLGWGGSGEQQRDGLLFCGQQKVM